mgnify:CR=1 FL=1
MRHGAAAPYLLDTPDQPHSAADAVDVALDQGIADRVEPPSVILSGEARCLSATAAAMSGNRCSSANPARRRPRHCASPPARLEASPRRVQSNLLRYTYTADAIVLRDGVVPSLPVRGPATRVTVPTTSDVRDAVQGFASRFDGGASQCARSTGPHARDSPGAGA